MATIKTTDYTHRFLARFVIEAKTPMAVGSGEKDIVTDALVATDVNGLPYIPGTSMAGVVRSMLKQQGFETDTFFGFQKKNDGEGSKIIFTEAKILNSKGEVVDGMDLSAIKNDSLLKNYEELPIRQHVRMTDKGVAANASKFDEQVVFAGTRFCFELEMVAQNDNHKEFNEVLQQLQNNTFRIGSGTRCGFGEIEEVEYQRRYLDLQKSEDLELYLEKSSKLSEKWSGWNVVNVAEDALPQDWTKYELKLQPEDFFLFGSGFGDDEADMTPVKGKKVVWNNGEGVLEENLVLIPATSVKGALAHRVAFHYNKLSKVFADKISPKEQDKFIGNNNEAVKELFGSEGEKDGTKMKNQKRGNLLFSDVIEEHMPDKILNHVAIDRFTGGAIDGALFSEKTTYGKGKSFTFTILVNNKALKGENVQSALEEALKDICKGLLPLGGGVNRGNGVFTGSLTKNGVVIYESK